MGKEGSWERGKLGSYEAGKLGKDRSWEVGKLRNAFGTACLFFSFKGLAAYPGKDGREEAKKKG